MPGIAGFSGAASIERLPTERGITGQVKSFQGEGAQLTLPTRPFGDHAFRAETDRL
jgi:hypothetical protein